MADPGNRPGKLVALCGSDGTGKETQTRRLAQRAGEAGWSVETVSFPRYGQGFFADLIERYLRGDFGASPVDVSPYMASLPYAGDRWQAAPRVRDWLTAGRLVIANRYVPANMAHQGAKLPDAEERRAFYAWDEELEYRVMQLPRPDVQVLLSLPVEVSAQLLRQRSRQTEGGELDIHERDLDYLAATTRAYHEVARQTTGPWVEVRCVAAGRLRSRDAIAADLWDAVRAVIGEPV